MEKNSFSNGDVISPDRSFRYCNGNGNSNEISLSRNSTQNGYGRRNFTTPNKFDSPYSNSSSPVDRYNRNSDPRSPRLLFSEDEEEELSVSLKDYYEKDLTALLETSFDCKNYCFNVRGARLPSADRLFTEEKWNNDKLLELQDIKRDLNAVKSKLNEYELTHWHKHTRAMNPADKVMKHLRRDVKVEFLTQAWCKFYELINKYKLIPTEARSSNELSSFHLCEAPGAFVASLNHYLKLNHPDLRWFWKANSLNPYYEGNNLSEMINDDRFMLQTIDHWDFGPDMTGDITHPDYPSYLRKNYSGLFHLVTADGSFDCQDKPEEQESSVSWLHLKETLNALNILRKNGNFVIKMFTFFECDTVCLLNLLAAAFQEIKVEKPATSKEGNSECYVVCQKYRGREAIGNCLDRLLEIDLETYQKYSMFPFETRNLLFYREITKCASRFAKMQMDVIERNIRIYETDPNDPNLRKHCDFLQEKFVQHYIKKYKLRPIKLEDNIVKLPKLKYQIDRKPPQVIESRDRKQGSHTERVQRSSLVANDLLRKINEELNDDLCNNLKYRCQFPRAFEIPVSAFSIKFGKPIEVVRSSQFCHGRFMRIRNEIIKTYGYRKFMIATNEPVDTLEDSFRNYSDFSNLFRQKDYNSAQRESLRLIYDRLLGLREGDYLKLIAFPLLTQFNINVLYVLRQMFREVMFNAPNVLLLLNLELDKFNLWKEKLYHLCEAYSPNCAVISFLPISCITGSHGGFYKSLVEANNSRLYYEIDRVIDLSCLRPRT